MQRARQGESRCLDVEGETREVAGVDLVRDFCGNAEASKHSANDTTREPQVRTSAASRFFWAVGCAHTPSVAERVVDEHESTAVVCLEVVDLLFVQDDPQLFAHKLHDVELVGKAGPVARKYFAESTTHAEPVALDERIDFVVTALERAVAIGDNALGERNDLNEQKVECRLRHRRSGSRTCSPGS